MIIQGPDFIMESSVSDERDSFDLQLMQYVKSKTNPRDEFKVVGYGITLMRCISKIAHNRIARKHKDEEGNDVPISLKQFAEDYQQAIQDIKAIIYGETLPEQ